MEKLICKRKLIRWDKWNNFDNVKGSLKIRIVLLQSKINLIVDWYRFQNILCFACCGLIFYFLISCIIYRDVHTFWCFFFQIISTYVRQGLRSNSLFLCLTGKQALVTPICFQCKVSLTAQIIDNQNMKKIMFNATFCNPKMCFFFGKKFFALQKFFIFCLIKDFEEQNCVQNCHAGPWPK